ncbi:TnsA endonuclease N-terminal domain-containing protein [Methylobacillus sp.]|uniref:TnsA endonuclease N-terminal domain-containing protein n=1 Tax=Methylobacillus sp. TaxID=56818 RepID=UPI002FE3F7B6
MRSLHESLGCKQQAEMGPVRRLTNTTPHRTVGGMFFPSITPYPAEYESQNEKHTLITLALCHDVMEIKSQPCKVSYIKESGKFGYHIPDFEVLTGSGRLLIEVKAVENLLEPANSAKYRQLGLHYKREHIAFRFLTNVQLEVKPRFQSVGLLQRYLTSQPDNATINRVQQELIDAPLHIYKLLRRLDLGLQEIYTLIARRHICFDWAQPLNQNTIVSLPNQPFRGLCLDDILHSTRFCDLLEKLAMGREPTDQSVVATAKTWRQIDNVPGIWGVVGGCVTGQPLCDIQKIGFLRGSHFRRNYAPGRAVSLNAKSEGA